MEKFIVQESETSPDEWICTDKENMIVCIWRNHKFNDTQNFKFIEEFDPKKQIELAKIMREFGDYLRANHYDKIF